MDQKIYGMVTVSDLMLFAGILLTALIISRMVSYFLPRRLKGRISDDQLQLIRKLLRVSILGIALVFSLPLLEVNLSGLAMAGGVAGVVIGFASQNIVSNLISGVFVMMERPIRIGNAVDIGGTTGIVEEIRIMSTIVRTFDGLYVRIPNINVFTSMLVNHEANIARRVDYIIGIRYSDDAAAAVKLIKGMLANEPLVFVKPEPLVFVGALADSSVNITVRAWAPIEKFWTLRFRLLQDLRKGLEDAGFAIPFPQRTIWMESEKDQLPKAMIEDVTAVPTRAEHLPTPDEEVVRKTPTS